MKATPQIGVCSYCGCTDDAPCRLPDNETCAWMNKLRTVCSKWGCTQAWMTDRKRARAIMRRDLREMRARIFDRERQERERRKAAKPVRPKTRRGAKGRLA